MRQFALLLLAALLAGCGQPSATADANIAQADANGIAAADAMPPFAEVDNAHPAAPEPAPIPVPAAWREPGAPQPASKLPAPRIRTRAKIEIRDVVMAIPPTLRRRLTGKCRGGFAAPRRMLAGIAVSHRRRDAQHRW